MTAEAIAIKDGKFFAIGSSLEIEKLKDPESKFLELSELAADGDFLLIYDTSATQLKKIQKSNIAATLSYTTRNYTGDGSTTGFTVTSGTAVDNVLVTENGVLQKPTTDYTISSTTLTFQGGAPASGVAIQIRELPR